MQLSHGNLQDSPVSIRKIQLPTAGMDFLLAEALAGGYKFVETLVEDWVTGENRFDGPGEILCGGFDGEQLIAVGGLNCDPFAGSPEVGRVRRVYVRAAWRNQGVGRALVGFLVDYARSGFSYVRLRAENDDAARLYERIGFLEIDSPDATHSLDLRKRFEKTI